MVAGNVEESGPTRAMWKVKRTLELVRIDGKGRVLGGGLQGFWLVGDSRGETVRTSAVGVPRAGGGMWGLEQRSGRERHTGEVGLQTENQIKGEVETAVIYKPRIYHVQGSLGGHTGVGVGAHRPCPQQLSTWGMVAERCKDTSTRNLNIES